MRSSRYIISVNNDDDAPINPICDLVIVGDLAEVLPQAAELIRARN
jgi:electron transfer flavoprotein alpha subunit